MTGQELKKLLIGKTLDEVVSCFGSDDIINIGAYTAFFFCGPAWQYFEDIDGIQKRSGRKQPSIKKYPYRSRKVIDAYNKLIKEDGVIILIEGKETGVYWIPEEYQQARERRLMRAQMAKSPESVKI